MKKRFIIMSVLCLALAPTANSMQVVVYFDRLQCIEHTVESGGGRDEVYMIVNGDSLTGFYYHRLPGDDDYYEFVDGQTGRADDHTTWTNKNQSFVGRPILWAGTLNENEGANIVVVIAEQDNADLGTVKDALEAGLGVIAPLITAAGTLASAAVAGASKVVEKIPDIKLHDVIGAFAVHIRNEGGLQYTIIPWNDYRFGAGRPGATTTLDGSSFYAAALGNERLKAGTLTFNAAAVGEEQRGRYVGVVAIRIVDALGDLERIEYLGTEIDRCGQPILRVRGRDGVVEVPRDARNARVDVPGREFFWDCGPDVTNDRTNGPDGTDLVYVSRGEQRRIEWNCYRKIPVLDTGTKDIHFWQPPRQCHWWVYMVGRSLIGLRQEEVSADGRSPIHRFKTAGDGAISALLSGFRGIVWLRFALPADPIHRKVAATILSPITSSTAPPGFRDRGGGAESVRDSGTQIGQGRASVPPKERIAKKVVANTLSSWWTELSDLWDLQIAVCRMTGISVLSVADCGLLAMARDDAPPVVAIHALRVEGWRCCIERRNDGRRTRKR